MLESKSTITAYRKMLASDFKRYRAIYMLAIPALAYYIIFHYVPMYGAVIAFKEFSPGKGILGSPWVGLKNFIQFFNSYQFFTVVKNTFLINIYELVWGFPAPILFAILMNEIRVAWYKKTVQTLTYLPHFISLVVICGMIIDFTSTDGLFNAILKNFGAEPANMLTKPELFRTIYIGSGIWQGVGWGSIIYLAALSAIDPELYEASKIDGAGRWKQTLHITLPGIAPTIIILLILRIGHMLSVGYEKIILLYNPLTYPTADVISSYVYRRGLLDSSYSFASAVGLFNSVINFSLLIIANKLSKKYSETHLW